MGKHARHPLITGLDVGTTKVCAVIGEVTPAGGLDVIGIGTSPSRGLRKGVVVNIDSTVEAIKKAVGEAERMAGAEVGSVPPCCVLLRHVPPGRALSSSVALC